MAQFNQSRELVQPRPALRQAIARGCKRDSDFLHIEQEAGLLCIHRGTEIAIF